MSSRLSVIIPALNEEPRIGDQLTRLASTPGIDEFVVVDGGSTDRTPATVRASGLARLVTSSPGRGTQMNAGARAATGDVLLFLHADVALPATVAALVAGALADAAVAGGAFRIETVPDGKPGWAARMLWLADLRSRYSRLPYGDQAMFVRRETFDRLGGFAPVPLFEDLEFSRRMRRVGRVRILTSTVQVSGRRFMARPVASAVLMNVLPVLYRLGVPTSTLARMYGQVR